MSMGFPRPFGRTTGVQTPFFFLTKEIETTFLPTPHSFP
ncbi:hypothetical protein LEP1GSC202_1818 [Leptospira yanagawae serovar Saopaulo str. Sao Paulo = ATCC 700523]|uniref:Uncharacterized protein n=1 Tax=Leptospira yanagawae serovar Saopaulo str. Sao Paulo = ATCC 700523 TaxID=1249483 RepID=A0A5E8HC97_9LEPT|nr:hypothetical protein LEP1GSC202_1818 [Leptospira yanagawae serovar Saopaulo str. Sao Paulo = ATCC 700523]